MRGSLLTLSLLATLTGLAALPGCREGGGAPAADTATLPAGSASAPGFVREAAAPAEPAPDTALAKAAPAEEEPTGDETGDEGDGAEEEPTATGDAIPEDGDEAKGDAPADEAPTGPVPSVEVRNVGMHVGGGKNTKEEKAPIRAAVAAHYDAMKRCWGKAVDPPKKATFGVDIRIPGAGGAPKISNPRSGLKGGGVRECLVAAFEAIEFPRQPHGSPRMVSYSLEFTKH
ncbi:MAG: hypothetical protein KC731_30435 [Myxococcales bacterium]|nr:hypothetical protein [Myxococcales bacterium]